MLDHLEWESLEARHAKNQLTMLFKIIHGLVDIPACDYLVLAPTRTLLEISPDPCFQRILQI